jgi:hypothetical protein
VPPDKGERYFWGGTPRSDSTATQRVDVSDATPAFQSNVEYNLETWIGGGWGDQNDRAILTATFLDEQGIALDQDRIGPVTVEDRNGEAGFRHRATNGTVPGGTTHVDLEQTIIHEVRNNDGMMDNIVLNFTVETATGLNECPNGSDTPSQAPTNPDDAVRDSCQAAKSAVPLDPCGTCWAPTASRPPSAPR